MSGTDSSVLAAAGDWLFKWRNLVFPVAFVLVLLADRPRIPGGDPRLDLLVDVVGIGLALAGQLVRVAVIGLVYIRRGGKDGKVHADELVQDGIFAHSRNPLYLGNLLVFLGLFTVLGSWAGWLFGVPATFLAYAAIVAAEERFLRRQFGAVYEDYCRRVNRYWPSLEGLGETLRAHRFDWRRVVRKEYGSTYTWTTAVVLLLIWERVRNGRAEAVREHAPAWGAAFAVILVAYGVARFLKKTGRLQDA